MLIVSLSVLFNFLPCPLLFWYSAAIAILASSHVNLFSYLNGTINLNDKITNSTFSFL